MRRSIEDGKTVNSIKYSNKRNTNFSERYLKDGNTNFPKLLLKDRPTKLGSNPKDRWRNNGCEP